MMRLIFTSLLFLASFSTKAQSVRYHGSDHYQIKVQQFRQEGSLPEKAVVMLGDSHSEYGEDWNRFFPSSKNIINRGIIGDDSRGILRRLNQILPYKPAKIFFECGANDLSHGWSVKRTFQGIVNIIETVRKQSPKTKLYVQSLLPMNQKVGTWKRLKGKEDMIIQLNERLKHYCSRHAVVFIDLYTPLLGTDPKAMRSEYCRDGLHLSAKGYEVWAETIRPFIND